MYRLYDTSSSSREVHAERTEQRKVQNLENSSIDAIRIFYHGSHRIKHSTAHDEGKRQRFARLSPFPSLFLQNTSWREVIDFLMDVTCLIIDNARRRRRERQEEARVDILLAYLFLYVNSNRRVVFHLEVTWKTFFPGIPDFVAFRQVVLSRLATLTNQKEPNTDSRNLENRENVSLVVIDKRAQWRVRSNCKI